MIALQQTAQGVVIPVRVRAGGRQNSVAGEHNGALRIDVTAAPEKGRANSAVATVLCKLLKIPKSAVELMSGATNCNKRFLVTHIDLAEIQRSLATALAEP